ncbi:uncharacterized protein LOC100369514 [Saccoglossus kowalevskii]|uniref:Uncharacterized methyltransferase C70.08c-like n=1 Tax=Saccoglossus kowalevskii TaxID=10224 RepID=A0ABM0GP90_SACKO|nr:PREDICTED: uncharacterized methyltransferase C70.08c-like [Saccoglossus kowalevskii]
MNPEEFRSFSTYRKPYVTEAVNEVVTRMPINSTDCLLDVGCGSGDFIKALVGEQQLRQVIALDINQGMIDTAKEMNSDPRIQYIVADAGNADGFKESWNNTFDKVVCYYVLPYIKNWKSVTLRGICDCLKPGGRAFINAVLKSSHGIQAVISGMDIPKWKHYFCDYTYPFYIEGVNKDDFANILKNIGFKVVFCESEDRDIIANDEVHARAICRQMTHHMKCIPAEKREDYFEDFFQHCKNESKQTGDGRIKWHLDVLTVVVEK